MSTQSQTVHLANSDFNLHYLESGQQHPADEVILLVHGWPTSSFLYRHMMEPLATAHRTIAIDLPGFGKSDKDPKASYSFKYHARIIQEFVEQQGITKVHLVVHDLGGPIGLWWAQQHAELIASYVILDTLVFPKFSGAVKLFVAMTMLPLVRTWLSGPGGIDFSMRFGIYNKACLTPEVLEGYRSPFKTKAARESLLKSASRLHMKGFDDIVASLPKIKVPVCMIYAENDKILPKVADTMRQIGEIIPHATLHTIPECGHFLQEEKPEPICEIMLDFYS